MSNEFNTIYHIPNKATKSYIQMFWDVTQCNNAFPFMIEILKLYINSIEGIYMEDSIHGDYRYLISEYLQKSSTRWQICPRISDDREKETIHSGFIAGKLQNQIESVNLSNDISTISVDNEGVVS